jgi:Ferredoxin
MRLRKFTVRVNHDKCIGYGMCIVGAPKVFVADANRQSVVVNSDADSLEAVLEVAASCPVGAIAVEDAETHEVIAF